MCVNDEMVNLDYIYLDLESFFNFYFYLFNLIFILSKTNLDAIHIWFDHLYSLLK
jgi:hypothetical protein